MAVQPLNKTKIIKKVTKHANRFHSDRYFRVGVSTRLNSGTLPMAGASAIIRKA